MALRALAHSALHLLLAFALAATVTAMPARAFAGEFQSMEMPSPEAGMPCGDMGADVDAGDAAGVPGADCDLEHCDWSACLGTACLPASPADRVAKAEPAPSRWTPVLRLSRTLDTLLRPPIA